MNVALVSPTTRQVGVHLGRARLALLHRARPTRTMFASLASEEQNAALRISKRAPPQLAPPINPAAARSPSRLAA